MSGKAVNERNNFKRSDKVVKSLKDKYGLTYSPLKEKYEQKSPYLRPRFLPPYMAVNRGMSSLVASPVPELM